MIAASLLLASTPAPLLPPQDASPAPAPVETDPLKRERRAAILIGARALDEDYWSPLDEPIALEALFEWNPNGTPIGFEFGTSLGIDTADVLGVDFTGSTFELYGGVRATADLADGHLRPYVALGPSMLVTDLSSEQSGFTISDDDMTFGLYARAGITWIFDGGFGLGVDYRKLFATDVNLYGVDGDVDFDQVTLAFSFGF